MFFFQAEDGIRVRDVTGVQTCALPIYFSAVIDVERIDSARRKLREEAPKFLPKTQMRPNKSERFRVERRHIDRSEERRVGKECRCRGCGWHVSRARISHRKGVALVMGI